jgi:uncharacterized protein (DUF736 family)
MAYELKENSWTLFRNKKKTEDKHPDYRGEINIDGNIYDLSAWTKETKTGEKYFSGLLSEKYVKSETEKKPEEDTDLPF